jgi:hypothetical protein
MMIYRTKWEENERTSMDKLIPETAMRLVTLLEKVRIGKLLQNMPKLVKMMAMVRMMERSLMVRD